MEKEIIKYLRENCPSFDEGDIYQKLSWMIITNKANNPLHIGDHIFTLVKYSIYTWGEDTLITYKLLLDDEIVYETCG